YYLGRQAGYVVSLPARLCWYVLRDPLDGGDGAHAEVPLEGGPVLGVVVADDRLRAGLGPLPPLVGDQRQDLLGVVLHQAAGAVDLAVQVQAAVRVLGPALEDEWMHVSEVDAPVARPVGRDGERVDHVDRRVEVLVDDALGGRPDPVAQAQPPDPGEVVQPGQVGAALLGGRAVRVHVAGVVGVPGDQAAHLALVGPLVQPVRGRSGVAGGDLLLPGEPAVPEPGAELLPVLHGQLGGLVGEHQVVLRRHHLVGLVHAADHDPAVVVVPVGGGLALVAAEPLHDAGGQVL